MAYRHVVGLGSVWEDDSPGDHDACGIFRWELEVKQTGNRLWIDFDPIAGDGDSWYDGWHHLTSSVKHSTMDWPCDEAGETIGKRVLVACVTTAKGKDASFSLSGSGSGSGFPASPSAGSGLSISYSPGYAGQKLEWVAKFQICPGGEGCPDVRVIANRASVSEGEYFWGDEVRRPPSRESGRVSRHMPQVAIGACDADLHQLRRERILPIDTDPNVETLSQATG